MIYCQVRRIYLTGQKGYSMDFKKHLLVSWELSLQHIVPLVLMTLVMFVLTFFTLGILTPVLMAGYMHAVLMIIRQGREPKIGDLFVCLRLFLPLLVFFFLAALVISLGFTLLVLPGLALLLVLALGTVYMLPLMTDQNMGLVDALKESMTMVFKGDIGENLVVVFIFYAIQAIGGIIAIGSLFSTPIAVVFLMSVYDERLSAGRQLRLP